MEANNMKAMREAFKKLDEELLFCEKNVELGVGFALEGLREHCRIVRKALNAALASPPRNCDKFVTQPEMSRAYEEYRKYAMKNYGNGLTGRVPTAKQKPMTYDEWMLAPAAEQKGESK